MTAEKGLSRRYIDTMTRCHKKFGKVPVALTGLLFKFPPTDVIEIFEILLDECPEIAAALAADEDDDNENEPTPLAMEIPDETRKLYGDGREVQ